MHLPCSCGRLVRAHRKTDAQMNKVSGVTKQTGSKVSAKTGVSSRPVSALTPAVSLLPESQVYCIFHRGNSLSLVEKAPRSELRIPQVQTVSDSEPSLSSDCVFSLVNVLSKHSAQ